MRLTIIKPTRKEVIGYILILLVCAFVVFAAWWDKVLPTVKRDKDTVPDEFAEERSDAIIRHLAVTIGARVVGHSGPISASVNFLMASFKEMNRQAGVTEDTRVTDLSGDYGLPGKGTGPQSYYYWEYQCPGEDGESARNVVARIRRQGRPLPSPRRPLLLLTAHFDTVEGSPGATDDAFGVALVMETARALLHHLQQTDSSALDRWEVMAVLFDGEEAGSIGARRFVSEYLLADGVKNPESTRTRHPAVVVLNIEGSGSAYGKSSLLRSLRGSGWLAGFFMRHSRRPYGASFTQFLFDMLGVGYTDIDTLKQLSNVHAVDMLPLDFRWNYHCPTDSYEQIAPGAQQHAGENYLSVARHLLASDSAIEIPGSRRDDTSRHFYLSFLGLFNVLVLSHRNKGILDLATVCVFVLCWVFMRRRRGASVRLTLVRCVGCVVSSLVLAVMVLVFVDKFLMRAGGRVPMCYLDNPWITLNFIRIATYLVVSAFVSVVLEVPLGRLRLSRADDDDWEACMGIFQCAVILLGFFSEFLRELTLINLASVVCLCLAWTTDYVLTIYGQKQLLPVIVARQTLLVLPAGFIFADLLQMISGKLPFYAENPGPTVPTTTGIFIGLLFMPLLRLSCYGQRTVVPHSEADMVSKEHQPESNGMSVVGGFLFAAALACACLVGCIAVKFIIPY